MKVVVKLGGTLLDDPDSRQRLAREIAAVAASGVETVVVHGGGKQMTAFLKERGIESQFVNGLRVTTAEVLDAVLKVLGGSVNQELVAGLVASGAKAVGLTGMDASLTEAEQMSAELGFVGRPLRSNPALLTLLTSNGYVPVVACVAGDRSGHFYNVNADRMAVSCATAFGADKLLFLTDVEGVKDAAGDIVPTVGPHDCRQLIQSGIATGGMQAKLDAAVTAIQSGLPELRIAPGAVSNVITMLLSGQSIGTCVVAEDQRNRV